MVAPTDGGRRGNIHIIMGTMITETALVTGAGSGIGRAVALAFAEEGAAVMVGDIAKGRRE